MWLDFLTRSASASIQMGLDSNQGLENPTESGVVEIVAVQWVEQVFKIDLAQGKIIEQETSGISIIRSTQL